MVIRRWTGPPVDTHTYLVADEASREAWVIDAPMDTAETVMAAAADEGYRVTRLVLTHGHFDHLMDVERYQAAGIPVALHPADLALLVHPQPALFGFPYPMPKVRVAEDLAEGNRLRLGDEEWIVWHVPGHAPGHVLLYNAARNTVLGGDMLFKGGFGRVDLPGCDPEQMRKSLKRLVGLPKETRVYPGHGPDTTLAAERTWLKDVLDRPLG